MSARPTNSSNVTIPRIAERIAEAGGRALIVGGSVRDDLLGRPFRDRDVEVLGLTLEALAELLAEFGRPHQVGRSFANLRLSGLDVDFSVAESPELDFAGAARRRDLTVNSMAMDPLSGEALDPYGGREDLVARRLRATDPQRFGDDPLRGLRTGRMAAELEMEPDPELVALCAAQDLSTVAPERIFDELCKGLLSARRPSRLFDFLEETGLLRYFPELDALGGVPQDPRWHPEGDVWIHTLMVVDEAARLREGVEDGLALMFGALCHDLGKPESTRGEKGRVLAHGHENQGVEVTRRFLEGIRAPVKLVRKVSGLVQHHLAPALYPRNDAGARGYRRLARKLAEAGLSMELLAELARADQLGRTTEAALTRQFPDGERFLEAARALGVSQQATPDAVLGRHLLARGLQPGPGFSEILERCRNDQDETGETDPERILERVL
ncbi:MAG: HD domain-containing protein [Myxococcota bacterium]|jgi:tRNA nucleotidyltransferase (CCA-adding enzyme)|nr:HD domain-containing protein [Myxococcota bacterium]